MNEEFLDFGKHKGERWTRVPISYLKWLINADTQYVDKAKEELERRGSVIEYDLEISGHAIDRASLKCRKQWYMYRKDKKEGIHSWLYRIAKEALEEHGEQEEIYYCQMKLCFAFGKYYPTLKTVIPNH